MFFVFLFYINESFSRTTNLWQSILKSRQYQIINNGKYDNLKSDYHKKLQNSYDQTQQIEKSKNERPAPPPPSDEIIKEEEVDILFPLQFILGINDFKIINQQSQRAIGYNVGITNNPNQNKLQIAYTWNHTYSKSTTIETLYNDDGSSTNTRADNKVNTAEQMLEISTMQDKVEFTFNFTQSLNSTEQSLAGNEINITSNAISSMLKLDINNIYDSGFTYWAILTYSRNRENRKYIPYHSISGTILGVKFSIYKSEKIPKFDISYGPLINMSVTDSDNVPDGYDEYGSPMYKSGILRNLGNVVHSFRLRFNINLLSNLSFNNTFFYQPVYERSTGIFHKRSNIRFPTNEINMGGHISLLSSISLDLGNNWIFTYTLNAIDQFGFYKTEPQTYTVPVLVDQTINLSKQFSVLF